MKKFWKAHAAFRMALMALLFIAGIVCVIAGWRMTSRLSGLGLMCLGVVVILLALFLYNAPFED